MRTSLFSVRCLYRQIPAMAALLSLAASTGAARTYPPVQSIDNSQLGKSIQRTMTLLESSTPTKRNTVRIIFYGQSITTQQWTVYLGRWLRQKYPYANIIIRNPSVDGYVMPTLEKISVHDLYPFYPDLMILYVYLNGNGDTLLTRLRETTTAEAGIIDAHCTGSGPANRCTPEGQDIWMHDFAAKYQYENMAVRLNWREYLTRNNLPIDSLLKDGTHLNDWGNFAMTELLKPYFHYDSSFSKEPWQDMTRTYAVGKDVDFVKGKLTLPVNGNRIDLIAAPGATASSARAAVSIDGKAPSSFWGCYYITRPNEQGTCDYWRDTSGRCTNYRAIATLIRVSKGAAVQPRAEDWTITFSNNTNFTLSGSITGADGSGARNQAFTSASGRIVLRAADWVADDPSVYKAGYQIKFSVVPTCADTFKAPSFSDTAIETITTVAQGIPNRGHTLELRAIGSGTVPVKAIRVYYPKWGRGQPAALALPQAPQAPTRAIGDRASVAIFDMRGRRVFSTASGRASKGVFSQATGCYIARYAESGRVYLRKSAGKR